MVPATSNRLKGKLKKATDVLRSTSSSSSSSSSRRSPSGLPKGVAASSPTGEAGCFNTPDSLLDLPSLNNMSHERTGYPTQKPLALLDLLVRAFCPPGGTVLDPTCGSGTTLIAATRAGRHALGFDQSPEAIETTRQRLNQHPSH